MEFSDTQNIFEILKTCFAFVLLLSRGIRMSFRGIKIVGMPASHLLRVQLPMGEPGRAEIEDFIRCTKPPLIYLM